MAMLTSARAQINVCEIPAFVQRSPQADERAVPPCAIDDRSARRVPHRRERGAAQYRSARFESADGSAVAALQRGLDAPYCNPIDQGGGREPTPLRDGGQGRNRTGVHGFAGRCMTTLPPGPTWRRELSRGPRKKRNLGGPRFRCTSGDLSRRLNGRQFAVEPGAGNETRTRDPDLGKVVLYQLSYSRGSRTSYDLCAVCQPLTAAPGM